MNETPLIDIRAVSELTGIKQRTIKIWSHDGRFPRHLKRNFKNEPYRWKRAEIVDWLSSGRDKNDARIREIVLEELNKIQTALISLNHQAGTTIPGQNQN